MHRNLPLTALLVFVLGATNVSSGCGPDEHTLQQTHGFGGTFGGPISSQGGAAVTSLSGTVDPTNTAFAGGMIACDSSCAGALVTQNGAALVATANYASTNAKTVYIPPGQYPLPCGNVIGGDSNLYISARNVFLRLTGTASSCAMLQIKNGSNIKIEGAVFSMRDATSVTTDTVLLKLGDGGTTTLDDLQLVDTAFIEGATGGGDYVRMDGGTTTTTVTNVQITQGSRFENSPRAGIDIRPGVQRLTISYNWFRSNANRDIWFEATGNGPTGQSAIIANNFERGTTGTEAAVTLSGFGAGNDADRVTFAFNHIKHVNGASNAVGTTWPAGGGTIEGTHLEHATIANNSIVTNLTSTSPSIHLTGDIVDVQVINNYVDRRGAASNAAVIQVTDDGTYQPLKNMVSRNRVLQYSGVAPAIDVSACSRCVVDSNDITYHASTAESGGTTGFSGVYCAGDSIGVCGGLWTQNQIAIDYLDQQASLALSTVTTNDNTVVQYVVPGLQGNTSTIQFVGDSATSAGSWSGTNFAVVIHYKPAATTVAQVETLLNTTPMVVKTSGTLTNVLQSGDAFGPTALSAVPAAGQPLAGLYASEGTASTIGALTIRDNLVNGALDEIWCNGNSSGAFPEGYPLVSGNIPVSITNEIAGGMTTFRTESTGDTETINAAGALAAAKHVSFISVAGGSALTLPAGLYDGFEKIVKIKAYSGSGNVTLTPSAMADGVSHNFTWNVSGGWIRVRWDNTYSTWRVVGLSSNVTLN